MISRRTAIFAVLVVSLLAFLVGRTTQINQPQVPDVKSVTDQNIAPLTTGVSSLLITSITPPSSLETARVSRVIDGDTIELSDGRRVRYIGIDTPETGDPRRGIECFGREAYEKNRELVEGKTVSLEKDVSETDKYGRLLRYVYINNVYPSYSGLKSQPCWDEKQIRWVYTETCSTRRSILVNELLVREGYANSSSYPPDIKYQNKFIEAQRLAREEEKGLWGSVCSVTPTKSMQGLSAGISSNETESTGFRCDCTKSCKDISTCDEAQFQLNTCRCKARDGDGDGVACDGAPLKCQL